MDTDVSFGRWLEKRRKALDLTREEFAHKVGCSVSALRKIETDERRPSKQLAEILASTLAVPTEERATFIRIARGELFLEQLKSPPPLPELGLLHPSQTLSNSIPFPSSPLTGRETELAALRQMLEDPQCRLITLVGPGGIGKTRLAIEIAIEQNKENGYDAVFVSLAPISSASLIVPAIADALGFKFQGSSDSRTQLINHLHEKKLLLLLDNFEHLLDGIELLAEIFQFAPKVKILCTSREQLNVRGEWVFDVRGLNVPDAVVLFASCARRIETGFAVRDDDQSAIARICRLVEGMPLAIELAATWIRVLPLSEIAQEIQRNLDFLSTNMHDLPERHRSMRAVFDHSWRLLTEEEQQAFSRLSVFRGGFTRELAEQVANANLIMLSALITKSLIHRTDEGRYDVHEVVRQYGLIQLESANMSEQTRAAHLRAFVQLAEAVEPYLTEGNPGRWLSYLEIEHDNFRAALQWAFDSGDTELSLRLSGALWRFWFLRSFLAEGSQWLERALQVAGPTAPAALRAKALIGAGYLAYHQNQNDQAIGWLEECLAMKPQLSERDIANAQVTLGLVVQEQHNFVRALSLYEEAIERFRSLNDEYGILRALNGEGTLAYDMGDLNRAEGLFDEALVLARKHGDSFSIAMVLVNQGWTVAIRGDAESIGLCQEALTSFCELGNKIGIAFSLEGIAAGIALEQRPEQAARLFGAAHALRKTISAFIGSINSLYLEAMIEPARNNLSPATFASAWAEGEAMTMEQAIEYAMTTEGK